MSFSLANNPLAAFTNSVVTILLVTVLSSCESTGVTLLNLSAKTNDYTVSKHIAYGGHQLNKLDVYRPAASVLTPDKKNKKQPVMIFFYGGCWGECTSLNKSDYLFVAQSFASRGYVTVIADFQQYPAVTFETLMQDVTKVVHWTTQYIDHYGGDPNHIIVSGHSSGAHIASMLALNTRYLSTADRKSIRGFIGLAGPYDFLPFNQDYLKKLFSTTATGGDLRDSQPIHFVSSQSPPLLLLHGAKDTKVGKHNSINLSRKAQQLGVPQQLIIYPQHDHISLLAAWSRALQNRSGVLSDSLKFIQKYTH